MIPMSDPDCNQVALAMSGNPDITYRCTRPEGHDERCGKDGAWDLMHHRHRAPVDTVTEPFPPAVGRRRRRRLHVATEGLREGTARLQMMIGSRS